MADTVEQERIETDAVAAEAERTRRQRMRSIAIALALGSMVAMFYAATIVRMGGNVSNRPLAVGIGNVLSNTFGSMTR